MVHEVAVDEREVALSEEHLNLRRLPPVAPIEPPRRFSQTLMRHANTCQRAAYLYVRHHGGMPAHALDRGTAYHLTQAKILDLLIEQHEAGHPLGEQEAELREETLREQPDAEGELVDEHTCKLLLEESIAEHPELTIPLHERDELRVMAVHFGTGYRTEPATGFYMDPGDIVAVEQKFVLELGDYTISGIIDVAAIRDGVAKIRDAKTEWNPPSQDEYEATFQGRLYAVLLVHGNPVSRSRCRTCGGVRGGDCAACEGRGYIETLAPPLGSRIEEVDVGETFPRHVEEDGSVVERNEVFKRIEVDAIRRDLEAQCVALARAFETGEFPAVSGTHCSRCPCEPECPLPARLRRFAGAINTREQAEEAAQWHFFWEPRLKATRAELKGWADANQTGIRVGEDLEWRFVETNKSVPADWEVIEEATQRAAETGEVIDVGALRTRKRGTEFKRVKLTESERAS